MAHQGAGHWQVQELGSSAFTEVVWNHLEDARLFMERIAIWSQERLGVSTSHYLGRVKLEGWLTRDNLRKRFCMARRRAFPDSLRPSVFICPVTAITFLQDKLDAQGTACLDEVLDQLTGSNLKLISDLYGFILNKTYGGRPEKECETFCQIIGAILTLKTPLPLNSENLTSMGAQSVPYTSWTYSHLYRLLPTSFHVWPRAESESTFAIHSVDEPSEKFKGQQFMRTMLEPGLSCSLFFLPTSTKGLIKSFGAPGGDFPSYTAAVTNIPRDQF